MSYDIPYMDYPIATGVCNNCGKHIYKKVEPSWYACWKHEEDGICVQGAVLMRDSWRLESSHFQFEGEK